MAKLYPWEIQCERGDGTGFIDENQEKLLEYFEEASELLDSGKSILYVSSLKSLK